MNRTCSLTLTFTKFECIRDSISFVSMKRTIALIMLMAIPFSAFAEPRKHRFDKKFWILAAVTVGSAFAANHTVHECQTRFGRDQGCFGGSYSSNNLKDGLRIGFTAGMVALAYAAKRNDAPTGVWATFQAAPLTWNTVTIAQNLRHKGCPVSICKDND